MVCAGAPASLDFRRRTRDCWLLSAWKLIVYDTWSAPDDVTHDRRQIVVVVGRFSSNLSHLSFHLPTPPSSHLPHAHGPDGSHAHSLCNYMGELHIHTCAPCMLSTFLGLSCPLIVVFTMHSWHGLSSWSLFSPLPFPLSLSRDIPFCRGGFRGSQDLIPFRPEQKGYYCSNGNYSCQDGRQCRSKGPASRRHVWTPEKSFS